LSTYLPKSTSFSSARTDLAVKLFMAAVVVAVAREIAAAVMVMLAVAVVVAVVVEVAVAGGDPFGPPVPRKCPSSY
jgi:hypothetical protein